MPWFPNPFTLTHAAREARRVLSGGGPKVMRLTGVTQPEGVIFPTSAVCLEVEARDRTVVRFAPEIPVPCPYAWGYRLGRRLELPLVSAVDPERISFDVTIPSGACSRSRVS
jgi:hypothetical protein